MLSWIGFVAFTVAGICLARWCVLLMSDDKNQALVPGRVLMREWNKQATVQLSSHVAMVLALVVSWNDTVMPLHRWLLARAGDNGTVGELYALAGTCIPFLIFAGVIPLFIILIGLMKRIDETPSIGANAKIHRPRLGRK